MKQLFIFTLILSLFTACQPKSAETGTTASSHIEDIRQAFAPDKRVALWAITDTMRQAKVILQGETNLPSAKKALLEKLTAAAIPYIDSIRVLPDEQLAGQLYGLVNVSVANLRSEDKHWGELASQVLLGTPLKIMKKVREGWYYVQSPDGYLAYLDAGALVLLNEAEFRRWQNKPKVVYWQDFGFSYLTPDTGSPVVSDLLMGNLLEKGVNNATHTEVIYPDGRTAFVANESIQPMQDWLDKADPSPTAFIETAKQFMGRPYLWGGTSGKGMDCSGFTKTVFYMHGLILQRDASQQVHTGTEIPLDDTFSQLAAGDFLFFGYQATAEKKEKVTHVGIYLGDGQFIHSGDDNPGIRIQSLKEGTPGFVPHRLAKLLRARRMWATPGENGVERIKDSEFYTAAALDQ